MIIFAVVPVGGITYLFSKISVTCDCECGRGGRCYKQSLLTFVIVLKCAAHVYNVIADVQKISATCL